MKRLKSWAALGAGAAMVAGLIALSEYSKPTCGPGEIVVRTMDWRGSGCAPGHQ